MPIAFKWCTITIQDLLEETCQMYETFCLSIFWTFSPNSDVLALPIFKQEESNLPPDSDNKILPFQYVLCAATSPAVKLHDETLTYLNQGQPFDLSHFNSQEYKHTRSWQYCKMMFRNGIQSIEKDWYLKFQGSPMKFECLIIEKWENFRKSLAKWLR